MRSLKTKDVPFILSSWLKSNYKMMCSYRPEHDNYYVAHQALVKLALEEDATIIACNANDEDQIIGWINFGDNYLNYVFVKEIFEGMGVATALIDQTGLSDNLVCTHWTRQFQSKMGKYDAIYNPYLFTAKECLNGIRNKGSEIFSRS